MIPVCLLLASGAFAQTPDPSAIPPANLPAVRSPQESQRSALEKQKASVAIQRQSVRRQAETAGLRVIPWNAEDPDCGPIAEPDLAPLVDGAAKTQRLAPELIRAIIEKESAFRPCAISPKGAQGLMQLMPATADQLGLRDVFDPRANIDAGAQYLRQLLDKYGDLAKALGAYNAGPATVDQAGGVPDIAETRDYVDAILKKKDPTRTVPPSVPTPKPIEN